jgi:hypothetical protein
MSKPIEFEKGKAGVVSKDKLSAVIDALIGAVRAGELDDLFSQAAKAGAREAPEGGLTINSGRRDQAISLSRFKRRH